MAYTIEYESSFTHDLTGRPFPKREKRATLESAEKRARAMMRRMSSREPSRTAIGGESGYIYLDAGPTLGAMIHRA